MQNAEEGPVIFIEG